MLFVLQFINYYFISWINTNLHKLYIFDLFKIYLESKTRHGLYWKKYWKYL